MRSLLLLGVVVLMWGGVPAEAREPTKKEHMRRKEQSLLDEVVALTNKKCGSEMSVRIDWTEWRLSDDPKAVKPHEGCAVFVKAVERACAQSSDPKEATRDFRSVRCGLGAIGYGRSVFSLGEDPYTFVFNYDDHYASKADFDALLDKKLSQLLR